MGKFLDALDVEQVNDLAAEGRGTWRLLSPLSYDSNSGFVYIAPKGFVTDFASVPRIPIIFDLFGDRANESAAMHDYLYSKECLYPISRLEADTLLREMIISQGIPEWIASSFYYGVRLGGRSHWKT